MDPVERFLYEPEPLTPAMLGLPNQASLIERLGKYLQIAEWDGDPQTPLAEPQRQHVLALIYGARIVVLEARVEEFEATGEMKVKLNVMERIARLTALRDAALSAMNPAPSDAALDFAPYISPWGVEP